MKNHTVNSLAAERCIQRQQELGRTLKKKEVKQIYNEVKALPRDKYPVLHNQFVIMIIGFITFWIVMIGFAYFWSTYFPGK